MSEIKEIKKTNKTIKTKTMVKKIKEVVKTDKFKKLILEIEKMNIKDLNDFVKKLQNYFDVKPMAFSNDVDIKDGSSDEENQLVSIILTASGQSKIAVIKVIGRLTGKSLMESKKLLDKIPTTILIEKTQDEAETIKKELMDAGASVEIK